MAMTQMHRRNDEVGVFGISGWSYGTGIPDNHFYNVPGSRSVRSMAQGYAC
jgi:hypothetical protein